MRDEGVSYRGIAKALGTSHVSIQRLINPNIGLVRRMPLAANDNTVIRAVPQNGGHSTAENPYNYIRMPRVGFIDGEAA